MDEHSIIGEAFEKLFSKMQMLDTKNLDISEYNKNYLLKYIENYSFYRSIYSQLLQKALIKLKKPVSESSFIDYGGGCGILSFLAKETGFKTVIYNDISEIQAADAQIISKSLHIEIDYFICADIEEFIDEINHLDIKPDLICSFDVLEHIYDLQLWIKTIGKLDSEFLLLFMTTANSCNPFIQYRLKKLHNKSENKGFENNIRLNNTFLNTSFLEERRKIISNTFPDLNNNDINLLSLRTRGLIRDDIVKIVGDYMKTGDVSYKINHPTNTCDPYTGSWTERLIDIKELENIVKSNNLRIDISSSFYGYSRNKLLNLPKYLLNQLMRISGPKNLLFSPAFTLEIQKL